MNKRIFSVLLCLLLALTLVFAVACGGKDDDGSNTNTDTGSTNTDTGSTDTGAGTNTDTNTDAGTNTDTNTDTNTEEAKHTVVFKLGNGGADKTYEVDHGKALATVPVNLSKAGYTFGGWTLNGEAWDKTSPITESITLDAVWVANDNLLLFDSNGGTGTMDNQTIKTDATAAITANTFIKSGYEFAGWSTTKGGEVAFEDGAEYTMGAVSPAVLYAVWTPVQYQIAYDVADGENHEDNPSYYTVESVVTFKNPTRDGWVFTGWEFMGSPIIDTESCMGGLSLVATWERERYGITYDFGSNVEGLVVTNANNPANINCDEVVNLADASVLGYSFVGWYKNAERTVPVTTLENVNEPIILYAKFEKAKFTIEYVCGDDVTNSGDNITEYDAETDFTFVNPTVSKIGYEFDGWYIQGTNTKLTAIVPNTLGQNLVLEARIKPIVYTITYDGLATAPSGYPATFTVDDIQSGKIALPSELTINGATFEGWYSDAGYENSITEITVDPSAPANVTVYAKVTATKYTITYVLGDKVAELVVTNENPSEYDVTSIVTFAPASVEGFAFKGWFSDETLETPITSTEGLYVNLTVYAKWGATVEQIGKNQVVVEESVLEDVTGHGSWELIFDGNCDSNGPGWYPAGGWGVTPGQTAVIELDEEYTISLAQMYIWTNSKTGNLEFFDAEGNSTLYVNLNWLGITDGSVMDLGENFKVKTIKFTKTEGQGAANTIQIFELILKVANSEE